MKKTNKKTVSTNQELLDSMDKNCEALYANAKEICNRQGLKLQEYLAKKIIEVAKDKTVDKVKKTIKKNIKEVVELKPSVLSKGLDILDSIMRESKEAIKGDGKDIRYTAKQTNQKIITDINIISSFLRNDVPDSYGRYFHDHLKISDNEMELCHDKIQWIFPIHEVSSFAQTFPLVTKELVEKVKDDEVIKANLLMATERMQRFYGIGAFYFNANRVKEWAKPYNHNLLRITRIIRSLKLFGLNDQSRIFYFAVLEAVNRTGCSDNLEFKKSLMYWAKAWGDDPWDSLRG